MLLFLMKHRTLSRYPRRGTCLFFMRPSISLLSLKIFCWSISHLSRPSSDVSICLRTRNVPTWARLNQFCSSLSTNTSIPLRLNSSSFLLVSLKTFNTKDISIKFRALLRSFLHFAQNYPNNVSKTLQSWCRALRAFYQTSLLPLCNVFYHVYEELKITRNRQHFICIKT